MSEVTNTPEGKVTAAPDHKMYDEEAAAFQDELGKFYADAINEKIEREK